MGDLLATRVVVTDLARFRKVIDLSDSKLVGLPSGHIHSDELRKIPPGGSFEVRDKRYYILSCDMHDFILDGLKRNTQIVYPKDAGYILMKMDIAPGKRIGEAGTGSGALTAVFSRAIGDEGRLYTYEHDIGLVNHAISTLGLGDGDTNIVIHHRALEEGIDEQDLDAFFLDVREPWKVLKTVYDALKPSGHLGVLVPTTNQVSRMLQGLNLYDILVTEVTEIFLRSYKHVPGRLRPLDRMVAHTGYLIFARKLRPGSYKPFQKDVPVFEEDDEPDAG
ncbi:MAG TPA: tRNA (adenine-N1)-methyltransferase [Deltaproteobacteria bacterium]|jgi:tRNA (adenine57-N1/adenine58-N1)-methyltransferase|nr:tRNA (adenine-N1)-methyltransferase [Deltaproteobacteria bacterium]HQJ08617.1 tRNA (adenine-N1)-methyltransferase [Deltaproteobacteria bacterium]